MTVLCCFLSKGCLALPKLNLQFLTLHDYLLRNFNLFRLESTYEIRQDIEDIVLRMKPWLVLQSYRITNLRCHNSVL